jgi:uncharacterized membrane protein YfcA
VVLRTRTLTGRVGTTQVFTALSTVSQYFVIGALNWQPALWFFVLGVLAAVVGQYGVQFVVKRFNKSSIISFLLVRSAYPRQPPQRL